LARVYRWQIPQIGSHILLLHCVHCSGRRREGLINSGQPLLYFEGSECRHWSGSIIPELEATQNAALGTRCLWYDQRFTPRTTGGSAQRFCCSGHRQQFWAAARRWTMQAIQTGLLSVDCLKGVSYERARCQRGVSVGKTPVGGRNTFAVVYECGISAGQGTSSPALPAKQFETQA